MKDAPRWCALGAIGAIVAFSLAGPMLIPWQPNAVNLHGTLEPPSRLHLLGTDNFGRDILSRLAAGGAWSISLAAASVAASAFLGTLLGMAAATLGGHSEWMILRFADLTMAFPKLLLTLLLAGAFGGNRFAIYAALVVTAWPEYCRVALAVSKTTLESPYVEAGRLLGFSPWFLARRYLAPVVRPYILPLTSLGFGHSILAVTSLSFLGFGTRPPEPAWGGMIAELAPYFNEACVQAIAPCILIFAVVLASQYLGQFPRTGVPAR